MVHILIEIKNGIRPRFRIWIADGHMREQHHELYDDELDRTNTYAQFFPFTLEK